MFVKYLSRSNGTTNTISMMSDRYFFDQIPQLSPLPPFPKGGLLGDLVVFLDRITVFAKVSTTEKLTFDEGELQADFIVKNPFKLLELARQINNVFSTE